MKYRQGMKRFLTILTLIMVVALDGFAQQNKQAMAQVNIVSKKERLSDFPTKTLKIVLPGEDYISMSLREAVKNSWSISAYEFCGADEYNRLKENQNYYFMLITKFEGKNYDGISYLSVVKGGPKSESKNNELVSMPLCPADEPMGREGAYMPAILDVMQNYLERSLSSGFKNITTMVEKAPKAGTMDIVLDENDIPAGLSDKVRQKKLAGVVRDMEGAAEAIRYGSYDTMVGYTISPASPQAGSVCYRMVFDARNHAMYYFQKHKISGSNGRGFLKKDIMKFTKGRK